MNSSGFKVGDIVRYEPRYSKVLRWGLIMGIRSFVDETAYVCLNEDGKLETYWVKYVGQLNLVSVRS